MNRGDDGVKVGGNRFCFFYFINKIMVLMVVSAAFPLSVLCCLLFLYVS